MRRQTNQQDSENENPAPEERAAQAAPATEPAEDDTVIVTLPDPDYDPDLDDGFAENSGQGRKLIDLDAGVDLEQAMKAMDRSLRKKAESDPAGAPVAQDTAIAPTQAAGEGEAGDEALKAQLEQERNNTLRAVADLHNFRRRTDEERVRLVRDANERLIQEILPIVDDFERSLAATRQAESYEHLVEGVEAVLRKIQDVLAKQGLEPIPALGEPFDPTVHEAVMVEEGSEQPDETVIEELRKGYKMNGRVVRPSLVKVAKS